MASALSPPYFQVNYALINRDGLPALVTQAYPKPKIRKEASRQAYPVTGCNPIFIKG